MSDLAGRLKSPLSPYAALRAHIDGVIIAETGEGFSLRYKSPSYSKRK
jgi:hypothetical protein